MYAYLLLYQVRMSHGKINSDRYDLKPIVYFSQIQHEPGLETDKYIASVLCYFFK